jgi:CheY-like chemotaxis protein
LHGVHILLVEDHHDSLDMFCTVLSTEGAVCDCVESAKDALAAAERAKPDVLVADLGVADGTPGLVNEVRRLVGPIPTICITGRAFPLDRARALEVGFQVHLAKPIEPDTLITVIERVAKRQARH